MQQGWLTQILVPKLIKSGFKWQVYLIQAHKYYFSSDLEIHAI